MSYAWMFLVLLWTGANATHIRLPECDPPDRPAFGFYAPRQDSYYPGDTVHYFCDIDYFLAGNSLRKCLATGEWTEDTPVCDRPSLFSSTTQTSTADYQSSSEFAVDGLKDTCSSTIGAWGDEWSGTFLTPGQLLRVMIFFPLGHAPFEVLIVNKRGEEIKCSHMMNIDRHEFTFENCPETHISGATGIKIRSLSNEPLRICEIQPYVLTSPKCTDPHVYIMNGHFILNRKTATLECLKGYTRSPDIKLDCIAEGVWNRRILYCDGPFWVDINQEVKRWRTGTDWRKYQDKERETTDA